MSLPSLTNALNFFGRAFDTGRDQVGGQATALFQIFVVLEIILAGLYLTFGSGTNLQSVAKKILTIGFFSWIISNYKEILRSVIDGFILVGQTAGSSTGVDFATLQDPDKVFIRGMQIAKPAADKLFAEISASTFYIPTVDSLFLAACITIAVLSFGIMAIQVFVTYLEFLLIKTAGFVLIPFGVFKPTAFLAERMFGAIIGFGIKLMVLALVIAVSDQFMQTISLPETVSWQEGAEFVIIALALCFLTLHAPAVALSLLSGSPHLSFGTVVGTGAATALAGDTAIRGIKSVGGTASAGGSIGMSALGAATGGVRAGWSGTPSSGEDSSGVGKAANFASRATNAALGIVSGPVSAATDNILGKITHGKDGSPNGQRAYRASIGDETLNRSGSEGMFGAFKSGMYSVKPFRQQDKQNREAKKSAEVPKKQDSKSPNDTDKKAI